MPRGLKVAGLVFFSLGWMAPFVYSVWILYDFIMHVLWPQARWGKTYDYPFHLFSIVHIIFLVSMAWLALSIVFWTIKIIKLTP